MRKNAIIPSAISSIRVATLPLLFHLFYNSSSFFCLLLFLFLGATDLIDGYVARKLKVNSDIGAFFDSTVDFILIIFMFLLFVDTGLYPIWLSGLIIFVFAQFVFSSILSKKLYDPVGKYYGGFLFIAVTLTLAFPNQAVCSFIVLSFVMFVAVSTASRITHFLGLLNIKKHRA